MIPARFPSEVLDNLVESRTRRTSRITDHPKFIEQIRELGNLMGGEITVSSASTSIIVRKSTSRYSIVLSVADEPPRLDEVKATPSKILTKYTRGVEPILSRLSTLQAKYGDSL